MKLDKEQRKNLSKALYDLGKLVFAVIILGQVVSSNGFKIGIFLSGFFVFIIIFVGAIILSKEG